MRATVIERDVYGDPGTGAWGVRAAVELPPPRTAEWKRWTVRAAVLWLLAAAFLSLAGCMPTPDALAACASGCPAGIKQADAVAGCVCAELPPTACSVERLLVTPLPPRPKAPQAPAVRP